MIWILSFVVVILSTALFFSVKKNLELFDELEKTSESIENSLKELDYYYKRVQKKSQLELFLDDPTVKELIEDMKGTKLVIKKIAQDFSPEEDNEQTLES